MQEDPRGITQEGRAEAEAQRRLQEVTVLNRVTTLIASAEDVAEALHDVCTELARFLQVPQAGFAILNQKRTAAEVIADYHPADRPSAMGVVLPVADNPSMAYILEHKAPLAVYDAQSDPLLAPVRDVMRQRSVQSILLVPVIAGGDVIGTLGFDAYQRREFSDSDIDLVQYVAGQVGQVLLRRRAESQRDATLAALRRRAEELDALQATVLDITIPHDLSTLLETIVERAAGLLNASSGGLYLCEPEQGQVRCVVSFNTPSDYRGTVLRLGEGAAGTVALTGKPLIIDDYRTWEGRAAAFEDEQPFLAVIAVPMIWQGQVIGVLHVLHRVQGRSFSRADLDLLSLFANHAAIAVENARLHEQAQQKIAERKQAEEALRRERDFAESLIETAQAIVLVLDPKGKIVRFNSYMEELSGYRLEKVRGQDWFTIFVPENERGPLRDAFARAMEDIQTRGNVSTLVTKDGRRREIEWYDKTLKDGQGRVVGLLAVGQDVTERTRAEEEIRRHTAQLEALRQVGLELAAELNLDDLLTSIVSRAVALVGGVSGGLYLYREEQDVIEWTMATGPGMAPIGTVLHRGEGLSGRVWETGRPMVVDDYQHWVGRAAAYEGYPFAAIIAVPVHWGGRFLGVLNVLADRPGAFSLADAELLSLFSHQAAVALQNAGLFERTQRQLEELTLLFDSSAALSTSLDVDTVLHTTARKITAALAAEGCALSLWDRERDALLTLLDYPWGAASGWRKPRTPGTTFPLDDYPASRWVMAERQPLVVQASDPDADPAEVAWMTSEGIRSLLMVPLVVGDQVIGLLELMENRRERIFSATEIGLCQTLANQASAALENARLYDETLQRSRELALLNRVIAASATVQAPEAILRTVCQELALAFGLPQVDAALLNEEKTVVSVVSGQSLEGRPPLLGQTLQLREDPALQTLLRDKLPLVLNDVPSDPHLAHLRDVMNEQGFASLLIVPFLVEGEVVGILSLAAAESGFFSELRVGLAGRVADQVTGALARARMEETQRRLSTAVEQSAGSVIITDTDGTMLYVNPAFERVTGYSRAEAVGQNPRILKSGQQGAAFYLGLWRALTAGEVWQGRFINRKKNGTFYTEESTITPVRDQKGQIVNYVAVNRDVTREVELEEQFRQAQKMEALGRLAGGIAHDFNNLLTVIHLTTRLMERKLRPEDPLWEQVQRIQEVGERGANLTKQLLSFSRRELIEPQVLSLNDLIGDLSEMLERIIGEDVELVASLAEDLWPVHVDRTQMDQIVVNLSVNARDAMPRGGRLTIETGNIVLDAGYVATHVGAQYGQYVMLAIGDTGIGMSDEVKAHLFEPFFTTKSAGGGTGLGLSTVYGIVKQHNGHIEVSSQLGQGTTFRIYLPRADAEPVRQPAPRASARTSSGTETILVAEDKDDVRDLIVEILREQGYRVLAVRDGWEACRLSDQYGAPIHLLLSDIVMPRMGGLELAERLQLKRTTMRVLYISGYVGSQLEHTGLDPSVAFLPKPFTVEALAAKVRAVLDAPA